MQYTGKNECYDALESLCAQVGSGSVLDEFIAMMSYDDYMRHANWLFTDWDEDITNWGDDPIESLAESAGAYTVLDEIARQMSADNLSEYIYWVCESFDIELD